MIDKDDLVDLDLSVVSILDLKKIVLKKKGVDVSSQTISIGSLIYPD